MQEVAYKWPTTLSPTPASPQDWFLYADDPGNDNLFSQTITYGCRLVHDMHFTKTSHGQAEVINMTLMRSD